MLAVDKDAVICDLAETYGIFNYRRYPVSYIATLAAGLEDTSRIKRKISGQTHSTDRILLAMVVDGLNTLAWMQTKDGQRGRNRPKSIAQELLNGKQEKEKEIKVFASVEEYEKARNKILGLEK